MAQATEEIEALRAEKMRLEKANMETRAKLRGLAEIIKE